jgi:hypothetical protein
MPIVSRGKDMKNTGFSCTVFTFMKDVFAKMEFFPADSRRFKGTQICAENVQRGFD